MQNKTIIQYAPIRMAKWKKLTTLSVRKDMEKLNNFPNAGGNEN